MRGQFKVHVFIMVIVFLSLGNRFVTFVIPQHMYTITNKTCIYLRIGNIYFGISICTMGLNSCFIKTNIEYIS